MMKKIVQAEFVDAIEEEFTPDFAVVGIYFGEGDPENGGEHWNFTQSIGEDEDEGVCTVKEIQQVTVYGGITSFTMTSSGIVCKFDSSTSKSTGVEELVINYKVSSSNWSKLYNMAKRVFRGEGYFQLNEEYTA